MGSPADLNLDYRPSAKKKNGGFARNEFVGTEKGGLEERLRCLEEERKKIDAFKRELPLCMQLVNDAIECVRQQMKQQSGNALPVLEEFIPIKKLSPEELRKEDGSMKTEKDYKEKMNWMRSAQLWIDNHDDLDLGNERTEDESFLSENSHSLSVNPGRGSFLQFKGGPALLKEGVSPDLSLSTESKPSCRALSSSPVQSAAQTQRKARRCWSPELHRRFVNALQQLGGAQVATPKQIKELMKVDGLTNDEVKSHLQKYRLHTRRTGVAAHSLANGQHGNSLALMGGIWMPHDVPSCRGTRGLKQSPAQSASPQGPLQLSVNQRTSNDSVEEEEDGNDDEETKSESYSWRGSHHRSGSVEVTE